MIVNLRSYINMNYWFLQVYDAVCNAVLWINSISRIIIDYPGEIGRIEDIDTVIGLATATISLSYETESAVPWQILKGHNLKKVVLSKESTFLFYIKSYFWSNSETNEIT